MEYNSTRIYPRNPTRLQDILRQNRRIQYPLRNTYYATRNPDDRIDWFVEKYRILCSSCWLYQAWRW